MLLMKVINKMLPSKKKSFVRYIDIKIMDTAIHF